MSQSLVERWTACLDDLSRRHHNDPITIEVLGPDVGAQIEARHVPLKGLSLDTKERPDGAVSILVEDRHGHHTERVVHGPVSVQVKTTASGTDEALAVEGRDGITTLVRFERCRRGRPAST